ncbi:MAG: hypothetical protein FXF47_02785 [Candidatus Mcinerneyibacterium aminivorans]|uniref:Uncharacterized protein n=1 Tax=Candidatus Mcinerneyibacterium aminivorans TaxID=2703815 RepID=A0A5D0MD64_9BACT|nr:MAG: hypothetical protein FXF47_02785 [Candidatus Mcinerneyibacterium aminivorans]
MENIPEVKYVETDALKELFQYARNSYKYLWAYSIIDEINYNRQEIEFETLVKRMLSKSWKPIFHYNLNYGKMDKIEAYIKKIQSRYNIPKNAGEKEVFKKLVKIDDKFMNEIIESFYSSLPYTFLSPFYKNLKGMSSYKKIKKIAELSNTTKKGIYQIDEDNNKLYLNSNWVKYFSKYRFHIEKWIIDNFKEYLETKNENKTEKIKILYEKKDRTLEYMNRSLFEIVRSIIKSLWELIFK